MWTALPRGADATRLELDVFISPRLGLDAAVDSYTLAEFAEFEHWTRTLGDRLTFEVELADGSRHAAEVVPAALDHDAWDHLFRATTFVRPWSFRDLSELPIYSFPARFVTAYLRDLYRDVGRKHPTTPPGRDDLDDFRKQLGPVTDVRVPEERRPPPRDPADLPRPDVPPPPGPKPEGCSAALWRMLRRICNWLRRLLGLPPLPPPLGPPPDPTPPKVKIPRVVHPSPYGAKPPLDPVVPPPIAAVEAQIDTTKVLPLACSYGDMATALTNRDPGFDFACVQRFYDRPEKPPFGAVPEPELDFHQAIGALGDFPALMRRLGLIVRMRIPRPATDPVSVRVVPSWDGQTRATDVGPRTRCTLSGDHFTAAERGGAELDGGMLDLTDADDRLALDTPKFDLIQVDSDGAALSAVLAAATLERQFQLLIENLLGIDLPDEQGTAALRSGGLAIVRPDRAYYVHKRLSEAADLLVAQPAPAADDPALLASDLYAEDLIRGYRVEVSADGGPWRSLCSRVGTYRLVDDAGTEVRELGPITDEGYVKSTSATSAEGEGKPLYVHEALARWTGWSLTVPRPGLTLEPQVPDSSSGNYESPAAPKSDARTEFRLETGFEPKPGTLPRLRFGTSYRVRVACVDLSGERMAPSAAGTATSKAVVHRRFEPVSPPAALAMRPFWPGESLERLVVRSDWDRDNATYDQQAMGAGSQDARAHRGRHLFPPKTAQQMAELHGKLDPAFGTGGDPDAGYRISLRESGTFREEKVIDVDTVDVDNPQATIPFGKPEPSDPTHPDAEGSYYVNRSDETLPTPYLPDPLAAGVALRGVPGLVDHVTGDPLAVHDVQVGDSPGVTEPLLQVPFDGDWPDTRPLRIRVAEQGGPGQAPPHWDAAKRLLTVDLPKAAQAEVRYSTYCGSAGLDLHGVWDWIDGGDASPQLRAQAEHGAHWMISPPRTLHLVHAVQRPLDTAHFPPGLQANRADIGQTTASLEGTLALDVPSTGRVDVIGRWTEPRDDKPGGPSAEPRESVAADFNVQEGWAGPLTISSPPAPGGPPELRHEFGDTRHRSVKYSVRATTRFREYLPTSLGPADIYRDSSAAEVAAVNVPSSARPDAPRVLYAVPTFDWPSPPPAAGWSNADQERGGGSLRVYLDRPWYSSGEGELLGVVMNTTGLLPLPDDLRSRYGVDAIWRGAAGNAVESLEPHHFPNRVAQGDHLSLVEDSGKGTVAGFAPEFDTARKLWFCDIQLDVGSLGWNYWPFLRLAFVRYQPDSITGAELSAIVIGEFAQVAPDRRLSLSWADPTHVKATLRGPAPIEPRAPRVAFRVQTTSVPAGTDADELDWEHAAGPSPTVDSSNFTTLVEPQDPDADGDVVWETVVELPAARGSKRMRLEVAEYELLAGDEEFGGGLARVTYAAHVSLD